MEKKSSSNLIKVLLLWLCLVVSCCVPGAAKPVTDSQKITVKRIQDYLNGIKTLKAKVIQLNPDQQHLTGTVYLSRVAITNYGKLRIEYDQKGQDLVIATGEKLILLNPQSKEKTTYAIDETPAAFLLQKKLDIETDFTVKSLTEKAGEVELVMTKFGAGDAFVTLKFSTIPMLKFNGWLVADVQGNRTDVNLKDVVINIDLTPSLFKVS